VAFTPISSVNWQRLVVFENELAKLKTEKDSKALTSYFTKEIAKLRKLIND